jgi:hypothetical protein
VNPRQTLVQAGLAVFHSPRDASNPAYQHDLEWFAQYECRKRRLLLRVESETWSFFQPSPPILWVLVTKLAPGFHLISPTWRGPPFFRISTFKQTYFANVTTDAEVAALLDEFFRRGGVDQQALEHWEARARAAGEPKNLASAAPWAR